MLCVIAPRIFLLCASHVMTDAVSGCEDAHTNKNQPDQRGANENSASVLVK